VNGIHKNYDAVFKDAMILFKDKTLDFFGLHDIPPIDEPLATEMVRVEVKTDILDLTFSLRDKRGLHIEEEVDLSYEDLLRIGSYHLDLCRVYKREFITVIFVKEPVKTYEVRTSQFNFTPTIIQCSQFDADAILVKLKAAIANGEPVNELELIYLPLFKSIKYSPTELFKESTALLNEMKAEDNLKRKIAALSVVLASKVVNRTVLEKYIEELKRMGNVIIEVFEEYGERIGLAKGLAKGREEAREELAIRMIAKGYDPLDIIELSEISVERFRKLREKYQQEAV
jgi:hypothetical protein